MLKIPLQIAPTSGFYHPLRICNDGRHQLPSCGFAATSHGLDPLKRGLPGSFFLVVPDTSDEVLSCED